MSRPTSDDGGTQHPSNVFSLPAVLEMAERLARRTPHPLKRLFLRLEARLSASVPLMGSTVQAGFPSPADDYLDRALDFNELLITNPAATFAVRVEGDSMIGAGIYPGDIAIVDRSLTVRDRAVILALVDGEFTLKRYRSRDGKAWLHAENPAYRDIPITEGTAFEVWGVVDKTIRMVGSQ